ncbi:MAG: FAD assembly factor SdhE [Gammaproteobacteria bacterium]
MTTEVPPRLRWSCRRGMLELDVLLGNYLEKAYPKAPAHEQALFVQLLDCGDQDLFNWLMGKEVPSDPNIQEIVGKIRENARNMP